jgi:hypothetical protein
MRQTNRHSLEQRERAAARWRKWNQERYWSLACPACEHKGEVLTTLKRLRASNIKCSGANSL